MLLTSAAPHDDASAPVPGWQLELERVQATVASDEVPVAGILAPRRWPHALASLHRKQSASEVV